VSLGLIWIAPFCGLLLTIAIVPAAAGQFWHRHFAGLSLIWGLAFAVPFLVLHGGEAASHALLHMLLLDYLPFIILLSVLFTVAGGVRLTGTIHGTPAVNTLMLAIGTGAASIMGTTGASLLIVRPLVRANRRRRHNAHVFMFLIFLVANIGGALTPLGPPLVIGFLQGVPFFWPTVHLLLPMLLVTVILLGMFYLLDRHLHRRGWHPESGPIEEIERLGIDGKANLPLLALIPVIVLLTGTLREPAPGFDLLGVPIDAATVLGNLALLAVAAVSLAATRSATRRANSFTWHPMLEVAAVFAAIFVTAIPALEMLRAGPEGALAPLLALVAPHGQPVDARYFWLAGALSSVLDNAPTYLMFFQMAGADAAVLTGPLASTLTAISCGAVMMGANTYIGNAPNFMVKAMCEEHGVAMPGFFGFMAWAAIILLPLYGLLTLLFFL